MKQEVKKYRLGNQQEEYELREDYLGWTPENDDWENLWAFGKMTDKQITIVNANSDEKLSLYFHHHLVRDAFPMHFFGEERAQRFFHFAKVSLTKNSKKFVIPLH